jgi:hypothetical protein
MTDEQAAIVNEIADHQMRGETFEHAVAATAAHWSDEQHRNDGGTVEPVATDVSIGCGEWC